MSSKTFLLTILVVTTFVSKKWNPHFYNNIIFYNKSLVVVLTNFSIPLKKSTLPKKKQKKVILLLESHVPVIFFKLRKFFWLIPCICLIDEVVKVVNEI